MNQYLIECPEYRIGWQRECFVGSSTGDLVPCRVIFDTGCEPPFCIGSQLFTQLGLDDAKLEGKTDIEVGAARTSQDSFQLADHVRVKLVHEDDADNKPPMGFAATYLPFREKSILQNWGCLRFMQSQRYLLLVRDAAFFLTQSEAEARLHTV